MFEALQKSYPQSFIIKKPLAGSAIIAAACFIFVILYQPLNTHSTGNLSYFQTMGIYALLIFTGLFLLISILKRTKYFKYGHKWTLAKEIVFLLIIVLGMGIYVYLSAFVVEPAADRLNIPTLIDSVKNAFLIGLIPLLLFTLVNYGFLHSKPVYIKENEHDRSEAMPKKTIKVQSQLKKEQLEFAPEHLVYAESDGNYVNFYLNADEKLVKKSIRNTISAVEQQLEAYNYLFRCHRAFIINLKHVTAKRGNSSGYRLKMTHTNFEIPVSRKHTHLFRKKIAEYAR